MKRTLAFSLDSGGATSNVNQTPSAIPFGGVVTGIFLSWQAAAAQDRLAVKLNGSDLDLEIEATTNNTSDHYYVSGLNVPIPEGTKPVLTQSGAGLVCRACLIVSV